MPIDGTLWARSAAIATPFPTPRYKPPPKYALLT